MCIVTAKTNYIFQYLHDSETKLYTTHSDNIMYKQMFDFKFLVQKQRYAIAFTYRH